MVDIPNDVRSDKGGETKETEIHNPLVTSPSLAFRSTTDTDKPKRAHVIKVTPEITQAKKDLRKSEGRLEHDIIRLTADKTNLVEQAKILEDLYSRAQASGFSKSTVRRLGSLLIEAQDKLKMLSGIMPESSITHDRVAMEKILKKWREYDHERTRQAVAEGRFHKNPDDKRAEGDVNRSRAAAYTLNQEINALVKQTGDTIVAEAPNPIPEEAISFSPSIPQSTSAPKEEVLSFAPPLPPTTFPVSPQVLPPTPSVEREKEVPIPVKETEKPVSVSAMLPELSIDQEESFSYTHEQAISDEKVRAEKLAGAPTAYILPKREPASPLVVAPVTPQAIITTPIVNAPEPAAPSSQFNKTLLQISASNPQAIIYAGTQIRKHLNELFGKNGFMGIGSEEGVDSPHWSDPVFGFGKKSVEEILGKDSFSALDEKAHFGLDDKASTEKMQEYLMFTMDETGIHPEPGEKVEDYLKRAAAITIDKYIDGKKPEAPIPESRVEKAVVEKTEVAPAPPSPELDIPPASAPIVKLSAPEKIIEPIHVTVDNGPVVEDIHPITEESVAPTQSINSVTELGYIAAPATTTETAPTASIMDTMVSASRTAVETPAPDIQQSPAELKSSDLAMMPRQFLPNNPQVIADADVEVEKHLDILFGTRGILGVGARRGKDSPNWKDPLNGFSNKTVAAVMEAEPEIYPAPGTPNIGMKNRLATTKVQDYIMLAMSETGVHPEPEERTEDYLKRAAAITLDKFIQKEEKPH